MHLITFHYANISGSMGIPGVIRKFVADLTALERQGTRILASDLVHCYSLTWSSDGTKIEQTQVPSPVEATRRTDIFLPWVAIGRVIRTMVTLKRKGSHIVIWPWGLISRQQGIANWNGGTTHLAKKRLTIRLLRVIFRPLADHYLVMSRSEVEDSRLPPSRCAVITMGKPESSIFQRLDEEAGGDAVHEDRFFTYVGRGMWKEKGLVHLADAATSQTPPNLPIHCFVSSEDQSLVEFRAADPAPGHLVWHSDVFGADLVPWLRSSAAVITVNRNPTPLRSLYEALYAGTPIIASREQSMDSVRDCLAAAGLEDAIRLIEPDDLTETLSTFKPLSHEKRRKLAALSREIFSGPNFASWLLTWLENPTGGAAYPPLSMGNTKPD